MSATVDNIIVGQATLLVGDYGAAEGSSVDVGAIDGGVTIENTREYFDVKADPWLGTVKKVKIDEKVIVRCMLAEGSLANLAVAFGYPTSAVAGSTFTFGGNATVTERVLYINGTAPSGGTRKVTLYKCVSVASGSHSYKKDDKTMIEVEFEILEDTSKTANQRFGTVVDTGSDTTAPTVALTTPVDGGTVTKDTSNTVVWTITETNFIDESTVVYGDTFQIINTTTPASATLEAGTIVYDSTAKTVTFTPSSTWTASDTFQAIVTTGLKDMAGNSLATPKIEQFSVTA